MEMGFNIETDLRNNFLQILHNMSSMKKLSKEEKRQRIKKIMDDMNFLGDGPSYIFEEEIQIYGYREKFADLDIMADKIDFSVDVPVEIDVDENGFPIDEDRIKRKQEELGIKIKPGKHLNNSFIVTRYGRSLLHEAVAMRDIILIAKYAREKKLLSAKDNNQNTPFQMALIMDYQEAIDILEPLNRGEQNES